MRPSCGAGEQITNHLPSGSRRVLVISGVLGFWVGYVCFPTWAIPVESAQVVARIVKYPADNPFFIYHTKVWTLLVQIPALLLKLGVSEIALSRTISGLLGMVSVQALTMFAYAIGGDGFLSIGSSFVVLFSRITDSGVVYPVMLVDTHHTYASHIRCARIVVHRPGDSPVRNRLGPDRRIPPGPFPSRSSIARFLVRCAHRWKLPDGVSRVSRAGPEGGAVVRRRCGSHAGESGGPAPFHRRAFGAPGSAGDGDLLPRVRQYLG
jgi:hypothetical protein